MRIFAVGHECRFLSWKGEKKKTPGIVCLTMITVTYLNKNKKNYSSRMLKGSTNTTVCTNLGLT